MSRTSPSGETVYVIRCKETGEYWTHNTQRGAGPERAYFGPDPTHCRQFANREAAEHHLPSVEGCFLGGLGTGPKCYTYKRIGEVEVVRIELHVPEAQP